MQLICICIVFVIDYSFLFCNQLCLNCVEESKFLFIFNDYNDSHCICNLFIILNAHFSNLELIFLILYVLLLCNIYIIVNQWTCLICLNYVFTYSLCYCARIFIYIFKTSFKTICEIIAVFFILLCIYLRSLIFLF